MEKEKNLLLKKHSLLMFGKAGEKLPGPMNCKPHFLEFMLQFLLDFQWSLLLHTTKFMCSFLKIIQLFVHDLDPDLMRNKEIEKELKEEELQKILQRNDF